MIVPSVIRLGFEPKTHSLEGCCSIQLSYQTCLRHFRAFSKTATTRNVISREYTCIEERPGEVATVWDAKLIIFFQSHYIFSGKILKTGKNT